MNGHHIIDCDGDWVSIATLGRPNLYLCTRCRGTRTIIGDPHDQPASAWTPGDALPAGLTWIPDGPEAHDDVSPSHARYSIAMLVAVAHAAFLFGVVFGAAVAHLL